MAATPKDRAKGGWPECLGRTIAQPFGLSRYQLNTTDHAFNLGRRTYWHKHRNLLRQAGGLCPLLRNGYAETCSILLIKIIFIPSEPLGKRTAER